MKYVHAADCWEELIDHSRVGCAHFNYFWCKVRADVALDLLERHSGIVWD